MANRIIELGGLPTNNPVNLEKNANAPYPGVAKELSDYDKIIKLVEAAEAGQLRSIIRLPRKPFGKDHDTYQLVTHILGEEITHEEMFENLEG